MVHEAAGVSLGCRPALCGKIGMQPIMMTTGYLWTGSNLNRVRFMSRNALCGSPG